MSQGDRVSEILGGYFARGEREDPEEVIRAHPDLAEPLRAGFRARELLGQAFATAHGPPVDGTRTIGDFRIVREIGRGGMGVVYEAEQVSMRRRVALKVLYPAITFSARAVERFRREAQAAGRVHHTNIVPVFAMGEEDGVLHYAMEWVRGPTLAQVIVDLRRLAGKPADAEAPTTPAVEIADPPTGDAEPTTDPGGLGTTSGGRSYYVRVAKTFAGVADALGLAHNAPRCCKTRRPSYRD